MLIAAATFGTENDFGYIIILEYYIYFVVLFLLLLSVNVVNV